MTSGIDRRTILLGAAALAVPFPAPATARAAAPLICASGGGQFPRDALRQTVKLAGGRRARAVICPFSNDDPDGAAAFARKILRGAGAGKAQVLDLSSRADALAQVAGADIVWYSGGYQKRQVLTLAAMPGLVVALRDAHRQGAAMIGGSAGAAVMSRLMISGGSNGTAYTRAGLGFLQNVVLDQHVIARRREWRLRQVIARNRGHTGVGLDEGTAIVLRDGTARVYGRSKVIVSKWQGGEVRETRFRRGQRFSLPG